MVPATPGLCSFPPTDASCRPMVSSNLQLQGSAKRCFNMICMTSRERDKSHSIQSLFTFVFFVFLGLRAEPPCHTHGLFSSECKEASSCSFFLSGRLNVVDCAILRWQSSLVMNIVSYKEVCTQWVQMSEDGTSRGSPRVSIILCALYLGNDKREDRKKRKLTPNSVFQSLQC